MHRQHVERLHLHHERFCRGDANLGAGARQQDAIDLARQAAAADVTDGDRVRPLLPRHAGGGERVGRLPTL